MFVAWSTEWRDGTLICVKNDKAVTAMAWREDGSGTCRWADDEAGRLMRTPLGIFVVEPLPEDPEDGYVV